MTRINVPATVRGKVGAPPVPPGPLALSISNPWAIATVHGSRRTESRDLPTDYRGLTLIHASGEWDYDAPDHTMMRTWMRTDQGRTATLARILHSAIIGWTVIADCHPCAADCCDDPWAEPLRLGRWHWRLGAAWPLPGPVPCKGKPGLWRPDPDVLVPVLRQLRTAAA